MAVAINRGEAGRLMVSDGKLSRQAPGAGRPLKRPETVDMVNLGKNLRAFHDRGLGELSFSWETGVTPAGDIVLTRHQEHGLIGLKDVCPKDGFTVRDVIFRDLLLLLGQVPSKVKDMESACAFAGGYLGRNVAIGESENVDPDNLLSVMFVLAGIVPLPSSYYAGGTTDVRRVLPDIDLLKFRFAHYPVQTDVQNDWVPEMSQIFPLQSITSADPGITGFCPDIKDGKFRLFTKTNPRILLLAFEFQKGAEHKHPVSPLDPDVRSFLDRVLGSVASVPNGNIFVSPHLRGRGIAGKWYFHYIEPYLLRSGFLGVQIKRTEMVLDSCTAFWRGAGIGELEENFDSADETGVYSYMFFPRLSMEIK